MQFMRDLDVQYKTAFALAHKLRESLIDEESRVLDNEVEVDAAYYAQLTAFRTALIVVLR